VAAGAAHDAQVGTAAALSTQVQPARRQMQLPTRDTAACCLWARLARPKRSPCGCVSPDA
jgi:hypothetical protein